MRDSEDLNPIIRWAIGQTKPEKDQAGKLVRRVPLAPLVDGSLMRDAETGRRSRVTFAENRKARFRYGIYAQLQKLIRDEGRKLQAGQLWDQFPNSRKEAETIEATNGREYRVYLLDDNDTEFIVQEDAKTGAVQRITFSTFRRYCTDARAEQKTDSQS